MDVLLLRETKVASDIQNVIQDVWGSPRCAWDWVASVGASRGLISIWKE